MSGSAEVQGADDEYMAMDADQWPEQDDIYENGDTLGGNEDIRSPNSRGEMKKDANNRRLPNTGNPGPALPAPRPLPDRYQTIRWPVNGGRGQKQPSRLALFQNTTLVLVVLCILLITSVIGLSFAHKILAAMDEKIDRLSKEISNLKNELVLMRNVSKSIYHISSTENSECFNECFDLYILNYEVLESKMNGSSFYLYRQGIYGGGCDMPFLWNCTSTLPINKSNV